jgi:cell division protein FtsI/penicillin-binding protein 2
MLGRTDSRLRLVSLLGIFALIASLLGLRLAYWQIGQSDMLRDLAATQVLQPGEELAIERGEILDRSGNVLATTAYRDLLAAYPDLMSDEERETVPTQLAQILGLTAEQEAELAAHFTADRPYVIVARQLTEAQSDAVRAGLADASLAQLALEPQARRTRPSPASCSASSTRKGLAATASSNRARTCYLGRVAPLHRQPAAPRQRPRVAASS